MPIYSTPGVYVQESLTPLATSPTNTGSSVAAFVGATAQGPLGATQVTSWNQFSQIYGGFGPGTQLLPFAVYQYFINGGRGCWVVRAVPSDSVSANLSLKDLTPSGSGGPKDGIKVAAVSPGAWSNALYVEVANSTAGGRFDLVIRLGGTADSNIVERFTDCSVDPSDARYVVSIVNSPYAGSSYVTLTNLKAAVSGYTYDATDDPLATLAPTALAGGTDGTVALDLVGAAQRLDLATDSNLDVNLPGVSDPATLNPLITWAEGRSDRFLVVDGPQAPAGASPSQVASGYTAMVSGAGALSKTSYAAIYGPWLVLADPVSSTPGAIRALPPGGAVLGQYSRNDTTSGTSKAPAGISTVLVGALDVEARFAGTDLDNLNNLGINVIRPVPGAGICIMGARTLKQGMPDRYVSIRRTLMVVDKGLKNATMFAAFESNGPDLWNQLSAIVTAYLTTLMQQGTLRGSTPAEAFFVTCDSTNNPPAQANSGTVNIDIGIALNAPAEFIILRISQYTAGSDATATAG